MNAIKIAKKYFEASNKSDFDLISSFFGPSTTYSSQNTGLYLGCDPIMIMQRNFHAKFNNLNWKINSIEELSPGIVKIDYTFIGELLDGEEVTSEGIEYIIVFNDNIQHIEIRNKSI